MHRPLFLPLVVALAVNLSGCDDRSDKTKGESPASPSSSSSSTAAPSPSDEDDLLPAVEVTTPRPRYALADLTDKALERLVTRSGFTPTVVSKAPPSEGSSTVRVAAFKKSAGKQLEAAVIVRCRKQDDHAAPFPAGEAYFRDGSCAMDVAVHLGVRNKTAESKLLLEALLAASADG